MLSHSGVAYSGWLPTSRYSRAPLRRNTLLLLPQDTTRRKRYLATSSGDSRLLPRKVQVTPYSFSRPKIRLSMVAHPTLRHGGPGGRQQGVTACVSAGPHQSTAMYLVSVNSSSPSCPPSRPSPDCFTPPNGAAGSDTTPRLMPTMPDSSASATRSDRRRSRV